MATKGNHLSAYKAENLPNGAHYNVGIVVSEWNQTYTCGMLDGARQVLTEAGVPEAKSILQFLQSESSRPVKQWIASFRKFVYTKATL